METLKWIIILFSIFVFVSGFLLFHFVDHGDDPNPFDLPAPDKEEDPSLEESVDHAILLESKEDGGIARLHVLDNAQETIDVTYYTLHPGASLDIFLGALVNAADRGVQVRVLLDGIFHNLRLSDRHILYGLESHRNIEIRYYEPMDFLQPWTLQNRLHDKLIVVDGKHVIIGGRNIGDRYFNSNGADTMVLDRDVWVTNNCEEESQKSVLPDVQRYFDELWDSPYSLANKQRLLRMQKYIGESYLEHLRETSRIFRKEYPEYIDGTYLLEKAHPTSGIHFIYNPIERWRKSPWIWESLIQLMAQSEDEVWLQSPYFIPSRQMRKDAERITGEDFGEFHENLEAKQYILTNSIENNPNFFGKIGYRYYRDRMIDVADEIYGYSGENSLHAKTFVIDRKVSMIGAFNYDPRSAYLSTESMIVIYSEGFAEELLDEMDQLTDESQVAVEVEISGSPVSRFFIRILSYLVPLIEPML